MRDLDQTASSVWGCRKCTCRQEDREELVKELTLKVESGLIAEAGTFMGCYSVPNGDLKWKLLNFIL